MVYRTAEGVLRAVASGVQRGGFTMATAEEDSLRFFPERSGGSAVNHWQVIDRLSFVYQLRGAGAKHPETPHANSRRMRARAVSGMPAWRTSARALM
jgi:hypothetical protein